MLEVSDVTDNWVTGYHVGYPIAPRINAAGRMHLASDVIELFHATSIERALELCTLVFPCFERRQREEFSSASLLFSRTNTDIA